MLFYILMTMIKVLAMIILIISDIILNIWLWVMVTYFLMLCKCPQYSSWISFLVTLLPFSALPLLLAGGLLLLRRPRRSSVHLNSFHVYID